MQAVEFKKLLLDVANSLGTNVNNSVLSFEKPGLNLEDYYTVCFQASDNLVNRSYRKWSLICLEQMVEKSIDIPLIINHDWDDVDAIKGFVYKTEMVKFDIVPEGYKQVLGYEEINKKIVQKEGLNIVLFYCAIPKFLEEDIQKLESIYNSCSTGGILLKVKLVCPNCSETRGVETTFTEKDKNGDYVCPHNIPSFWSAYYCDEETSEYDFADYAEIKGDYDSVELSIVVSGNLPNARIKR